MQPTTTDILQLDCITLWRPWANWVAEGWKTTETRLHDRFKGLRGRLIGIHAGLNWDKSARDAAAAYMSETQANFFNGYNGSAGHVVCVARVVGARWLLNEESRDALIDCGSTRRFGLILEDVVKLPTCAETVATGRQGLFSIPISAAFLKSAGVKIETSKGLFV